MPNVMLIANDEAVRNEVEGALAGPRSQVVTVADPRTAVQRAMEIEPGSILVDMQVGSMGGMAVVRALKDAFILGKAAEVPLVLLLDRQADTFLADRAGADAWVVKPFSAQALRAVLSPQTTV